jgi:hypothetical protein
VPLGPEVTSNRLAQEECATQIGVDDGIPLGGRLIEHGLAHRDTRVVDQDVEATETLQRLYRVKFSSTRAARGFVERDDFAADFGADRRQPSASAVNLWKALQPIAK